MCSSGTRVLFDGINNISSEDRAFRGGNWVDSEDFLRSSVRRNGGPASSGVGVGFRVAASVPEPTATVLMIGTGMVLLARRRRESAL